MPKPGANPAKQASWDAAAEAATRHATADANAVNARNLLRSIATAAAAHSQYSRALVTALRQVSQGKGGHFRVLDAALLRRTAQLFGVGTSDRGDLEAAAGLADFFLAQFAWSEHANGMLKFAPRKRQAVWKKLGIEPNGIDASIVEGLQRTQVEVAHDSRDLIMRALKCSLADGWCASAIAITVSDILFGAPHPVRSRVGLGVLAEDKVNIVLCGKEPLLAEMIVAASCNEELLAHARSQGAAGINLAALGSNAALLRHGLPIVGEVLPPEAALLTGAVELMILGDENMASPGDTGDRFHTKIVSASASARGLEAEWVGFDLENGYAQASRLVRTAIDNFPRRDRNRVHIPPESSEFLAGFSNNAIVHMLGGRFRATLRPLIDAIVEGRIRGLAGIFGCPNPNTAAGQAQVRTVEELIKRDILVLQTGGAAIACAQAGLLLPEAAAKAGPGLREICEAVGIPPVLHMGTAVDYARILMAAGAVLEEAGVEDLADLPVAMAAPEWTGEEAAAAAHCLVASGFYVVLGDRLYTD
ncbi:MAG: hypothetical protein ABSD88_04220, partial [Candidatus Korobacteraceae bacterium]